MQENLATAPPIIHANQYVSSRHNNSRDVGVLRIAEVLKRQMEGKVAEIARDGGIPQRVCATGIAVHHVDLSAGQQVPRQFSHPCNESIVDGIIKGVFCLSRSQGLSRAVQGRVRDLQAAIARQSNLTGYLCSSEI